MNKKWFNRNLIGFSLTSFLSDFCHEMATSILPQFIQMIGLSASSLGFIEGIADAASSFVKLFAGYIGDKTSNRKKWVVSGYSLTTAAITIFVFAFSLPLILIGRVVGWLGRGIRSPIRDAMLAESVDEEDRGKAFGLHRALDTAGAIAGPLTAFAVLTYLSTNTEIGRFINSFLPKSTGQDSIFRFIFILTLIPGILSVLSISLLVKEKYHQGNKKMKFSKTFKEMPSDFRFFLLSVGIFGMADFAPTLMVLRASTSLAGTLGIFEAARYATFFYLLRNSVYAIASYPIGALSNRFKRARYLATGYGVAVVAFLGFAIGVPSVKWFIFCFILSGIFIAWEDTIEGVAVRDYIGEESASTAYGLLGVVNGAGDFFSSTIVGLLWMAVGARWGFLYAVFIGLAGTVLMFFTPSRKDNSGTMQRR
ncbi:MAG: MFS transporter [Candidatus Omnitrophica bacterium]|nr:MFS transporter [Candidatus Omnitrophota bacterium]